MLTLLEGDCLDQLRTLPDESAHCCVTSPPYWGLRDYGVAGQIGLETTPQEYVAKMVAVFVEVRRVLRDDGTCWVNLGDSYATNGTNPPHKGLSKHVGQPSGMRASERGDVAFNVKRTLQDLKPKDLCGIPWRVAFALQADGWYLRSDIIWHKPNPMPESVTDRPTKSHEYIFLLSKSERYWYDSEAIKEPLKESSIARGEYGHNSAFKGQFVGSPTDGRHQNGKQVKKLSELQDPNGRNRRSVWTVPTASYSEAHFATFPPDLIKPCILAGCPVGGTVLDPFGGSGTTGMVALELGRKAILIELNPKYVELAKVRTFVTPGLAF